MINMKPLTIVLLVLVAFIYIKYNMSYTNHYEILQASPRSLTWDLLREKNPIVITRNQNLDDAFKYLYITKQTVDLLPSDSPSTNKARFCVLRMMQNQKGASRIEIINPKYKNDKNYQSVEIILNDTKSLILPQHWMYKKDTHISCDSYHGWFSLLYSSLF